MSALKAKTHVEAPAAHPNEFDRRRIERALEGRSRYRYVAPTVTAEGAGYRIESPNCSRNIDPEGGVVDVARLTCEGERRAWRLYRKNHEDDSWELHSLYPRLHEALEALTQDPHREFWQ